MSFYTRDLQLNAVCHFHRSDVTLHFSRLLFMRSKISFSVSFNYDRDTYHISLSEDPEADDRFLLNDGEFPFPLSFDPHSTIRDNSEELLVLTDDEPDDAIHLAVALQFLFQQFPDQFRALRSFGRF